MTPATLTTKDAVTDSFVDMVNVVGEVEPESAPLQLLKRYLEAASAWIGIVVPQAQLPELGVIVPWPTTLVVSAQERPCKKVAVMFMFELRVIVAGSAVLTKSPVKPLKP